MSDNATTQDQNNDSATDAEVTQRPARRRPRRATRPVMTPEERAAAEADEQRKAEEQREAETAASVAQATDASDDNAVDEAETDGATIGQAADAEEATDLAAAADGEQGAQTPSVPDRPRRAAQSAEIDVFAAFGVNRDEISTGAGEVSQAAEVELDIPERAGEEAPKKKGSRGSGRRKKATETAAADEDGTDDKDAPQQRSGRIKTSPRDEPVAHGDDAETGREAAESEAEAGPDEDGGAPRLPATALLFQAPDISAARASRRANAPAGPPEPVEDDDADDADGRDEAGGRDDVEDTGDQSDAESEGSEQRQGRSGRRRRRGGRGRRRGGQNDAGEGSEDSDPGREQDRASQSQKDQVRQKQDGEKQDEKGQDVEFSGSDQNNGGSKKGSGKGRSGRSSGQQDKSEKSVEDAKDSEDADQSKDDGNGSDGESDGQGGSSRRRRRRRSRGNRGGSGDDGGRAARDEVTALKGSTRLEAKRQRRRDGRDSQRRRSIITEAEFLARRESVKRDMVVREREGRTQVAILEDDVLVEHYVARKSQTSMVGNVYLGRVQNVLPSMEAAFIDIGKGRNAVLYAGEVNWDAAGLDGQPRRIEQALSSGDSVLVQVSKDPVGHKGARLTSQITLAGRYLVLVPSGAMTGISRKLPDTERNRLKKLLKEIVPDGQGVIVRTAAEGASEEELRRDVERLTKQWADIEKKSGRKSTNAPTLLKGEPELATRVVRDVFNEDFASLTVAGDEAWKTISEYVDAVAPDLTERLHHWTENKDVFTKNRIDEQLAKGLDRKVWLPSGGSLVIDRTEAMTVVDVNTGKFTGSGGTLEETVTRNNLEAAEEIVRQLRLRDIGGIIVIDFIDMVLEANRDLVLRRLVECLGRDRTRHQVAEVTSLGLVQMTRKRVGQGLLEAFSETCEHCNGRGFMVHSEPVGATDHSPQGESGKSSRRGGKGRSADKGNGPSRTVEPEEDPEQRAAVRATLATIAAAAAHAHSHDEQAKASDNAENAEKASSDVEGTSDDTEKASGNTEGNSGDVEKVSGDGDGTTKASGDAGAADEASAEVTIDDKAAVTVPPASDLDVTSPHVGPADAPTADDERDPSAPEPAVIGQTGPESATAEGGDASAAQVQAATDAFGAVDGSTVPEGDSDPGEGGVVEAPDLVQPVSES